jgi:Holliday junction DNA helicase, RuvA subunit
MIAYLEGQLHEVGQDSIVLLVGGVGYLLHVSKPTLQQLPALGAKVSLQVHTVVREDSFSLYGFRRSHERELFLKLLQVSGIGPKVALTILSGLDVHDFAEAIGREDLVRLTAIPGIGKKTAERLILELKDKMIGFLAQASREDPQYVPAPLSTVAEEAISALVNLGYTRQEAQKALQSLPKNSELPLEVLLREGLKALS